MKHIKYVTLFFLSLVAISNTTQCMKQLSQLGKPVYSKKITGIWYITRNPDGKLLSVTGKSTPAIIIDWKNNVEVNVLKLHCGSPANELHIDLDYPTTYIYNNYTKKTKTINLKKLSPQLYPDINDKISYRELMRKYEESGHYNQSSFAPLPLTRILSYDDKSKFKKIKKILGNNTKIQELSSGMRYVAFTTKHQTAQKVKPLNIFNIKLKKTIFSIDGYYICKLLGSSYICTYDGEKIEIFDLDTISLKDDTFKQKMKNNKKYLDVRIKTEEY